MCTGGEGRNLVGTLRPTFQSISVLPTFQLFDFYKYSMAGILFKKTQKTMINKSFMAFF